MRGWWRRKAEITVRSLQLNDIDGMNYYERLRSAVKDAGESIYSSSEELISNMISNCELESVRPIACAGLASRSRSRVTYRIW